MKKPTMQEVLKLVTFGRGSGGDLFVRQVHGDIKEDVRGGVGGSVKGFVHGDVWGSVLGDVKGNVIGNINGNVHGRINGKEWTLVESPKEKIIRMIREGKGEQAIDMIELTGIFGD
jgi:outer membrane lipoprotein SlyB